MQSFLWLGLLTILMLGLVILAKHEKKVVELFFDVSSDSAGNKIGDSTDIDLTKIADASIRQSLYDSNVYDDVKSSEVPNDYTVEIVNSTKVPQAPFPPCVGFVDEVVYAPSDVDANIRQIKADMANLRKNIPNYVIDEVNQQTGPLVKGLLRQKGYPLTDDQYGQNDWNCD